MTAVSIEFEEFSKLFELLKFLSTDEDEEKTESDEN